MATGHVWSCTIGVWETVVDGRRDSSGPTALRPTLGYESVRSGSRGVAEEGASRTAGADNGVTAQTEGEEVDLLPLLLRVVGVSTV